MGASPVVGPAQAHLGQGAADHRGHHRPGASARPCCVMASLTFLGLGVTPPAPTWGGMLASDLGYLTQQPWAPLFPGLLIMLTVGSLNLLADAIRDATPDGVRRGWRRTARRRRRVRPHRSWRAARRRSGPHADEPEPARSEDARVPAA